MALLFFNSFLTNHSIQKMKIKRFSEWLNISRFPACFKTWFDHHRSQNRINLLEIVESYPSLHSTVSQTCLELLLAFEVAIQLQGPPINLMTMFPNWLRGSLKKGIYKVIFTMLHSVSILWQLFGVSPS